ncbi:hypothetical protein BSZ32_08155 [Rubritalea profundi]|uniref:Uncharacterized protein n=1 Tax=Rubritalea profundi TaxID=1658618 RepID=A0A2S7U0G6_9BACT|nr:hypothetical protein BSZ32_08155 [Rubritalea profundi]
MVEVAALQLGIRNYELEIFAFGYGQNIGNTFTCLLPFVGLVRFVVEIALFQLRINNSSTMGTGRTLDEQ